MDLLFQSPMWTDLALFLNRVLLGTFFILARFRFFYSPDHPEQPWLNPTRHQTLKDKMAHCGLDGWPYVTACFVAGVEVSAGVAVILGLFTTLAALGLLIILIRAMMCISMEKVSRQSPVDRVDVVSCYLWTPEPVYTVLAIIAVVGGAGAWSLDHMVMQWFA